MFEDSVSVTLDIPSEWRNALHKQDDNTQTDLIATRSVVLQVGKTVSKEVRMSQGFPSTHLLDPNR